jgi:hypothetical protein
MSMTPYLSKLMIYHQVHQLSRDGFSISYISKFLGLNWRTVKRLLSVEDDRDYEKYLQTCSIKNKVLEPYESFVKSRLELYRDTSSAQMHDWLKEHFTDFPPVSPKTVFNFVAWVRQQYHLPKTDEVRIYGMVEETSYGLQGQVDFGVYNMRNSQGKRVKVYFLTMVLSRSRYKYVLFSTEPFTSHTAIDAHEKAFVFLEGIPDTLVYDQDRVFMVDENNGDLILTDAFKSYQQQRGFRLHFCRKSDPQSKGKVENVVKYVKQNFLYNRTFVDIDLLNSEVLAWLARTANELPHSFTRKRPVAEWEIEKPFLRPVSHVVICRPNAIEYTVRKDNSFSYKGNFYSLPGGTYKGRGSKVLLEKQGTCIVIYDLGHKELCRHLVSTGRGGKIINNDHRREKSQAIIELEDQFCSLLADPSKGRQLVSAIRQDKPRYVRDQLMILVQVASTTTPQIVDEALAYCQQHGINGAGDFKAIVTHYLYKQTDDVQQGTSLQLTLNPLNNQPPDQALIQPATSSINDYDMF